MTVENQGSKRNNHVKPILIENELKTSFLDYAMSVIVSRAIPDVRDGLKPVHRRILYTMYQLGFWHNKPYHKSVRVVGDVLGKYHPHGDQAVYNSMVGMVQNFSKRYPLLDGQGNWGSVDGDNAAAMRYTEVRMAKIAGEILADLDKGTVPFMPNFDDSTTEPTVLPSRLPNLLVNGTAGIAVGMATSVPPHNLNEVINACLALLDNEAIEDDKLFELLPAPDFPTGGIICGRAGIIKAYTTGRGNLILRGVVSVEETKKGSSIIISELPYQANKAELAIKIADLVKDKIIEGITNIRDESDKKGMRLVIEIKRGEIPDVIINQLYKYTTLQSSVSILMLALLDNRPQIFTLRELLEEFVRHRHDIIYRRTQYDLQRADERAHILAGFIIVLNNIDEAIALIKASRSIEDAIAELHKKFALTQAQGKAILDMRLQRLTGMEQEKIHLEMEELKQTIAFYKSILENKEVLKQQVREELVKIKEDYGDARRTRIEGAIDLLTEADLIPEESVVVTLTRKGYMKRVPLAVYGVQHRGGKGKMGMTDLGESDDIVQDIFIAGTHDELLFFTNLGRVYSLNVFEVPEGSRTARGRAVVNILPLVDGEKVVKLLPTAELKGNLVLLSKNGIIKRVDAEEFAKIRKTGIRAVSLKDGDELVFCDLSSGNDDIIIATAKGSGIRFKETEVRVMGRQAAGVMGIRLRKGDFVVGMEVIPDESKDILFATARGYGKRVAVKDFRVAHRGGLGVRTIPTDERNGGVIGLTLVDDNSSLLLIDEAGKIIRLSPKEIRTMGRQAKGVRLIRLEPEQRLANVVAFEEPESEDLNGLPESGAEVKAALKADDMDTAHVAIELDPVEQQEYIELESYDDEEVSIEDPEDDDEFDTLIV